MRKLRCRKSESHGWDPSATGSQILNLEGLAPKPLSLLRASQDAAASKVSEQTLRIEGIRTEDVVKGARGPGAGPLQELVLSCREGLVFGKPGLQAQRHQSQGQGAFREHCSEKALLQTLFMRVPFS